MDCKKCGSGKTIKYGTLEKWKAGTPRRIQRWLCRNCGHVSMGKEVKRG